MSRHDLLDIRWRLKKELVEDGCIMTGEHVDYGGGCHGALFLSIQRLLREPGRAWRLADDLCACIPPALRGQIDVVAGCDSVGSIFGLLMAGLLDSNRPLLGSRCHFAMAEHDSQRARSCASVAGPLSSDRVLLVSEWSEADRRPNQCGPIVQSAAATVVARVALWGWPAPLGQGGVPLIVLCDWIVRSGVRDSECQHCRDSRREMLLNHRARKFNALGP
jgi:hypothetical protein